MTQAMMVSAAAVRDYIQLNPTPSTSQYTDATIGSNILAAQGVLEQATGRWFANRESATWIGTSNGMTQVTLPGFRTIDSVSWSGTTLTVDEGYYAIPDNQQTGLYTGLQFRAFRGRGSGPWWLSYPNWFDNNLDSPWHPANHGGSLSYGSLPNDLTVTGDGGYAVGTEPYTLLHAVKVLAAFFTMRPASILADTAITAQGGVINYSEMPAEVRDFIRMFRGGTQVVSVG